VSRLVKSQSINKQQLRNYYGFLLAIFEPFVSPLLIFFELILSISQFAEILAR